MKTAFPHLWCGPSDPNEIRHSNCTSGRTIEILGSRVLQGFELRKTPLRLKHPKEARIGAPRSECSGSHASVNRPHYPWPG